MPVIGGIKGKLVFIPDDTGVENKTYTTGWVCATEHGFDYIHPAAKVIESGYFCPKCGRRREFDNEKVRWVHLCSISDRGISY